MPSQPTTPRRVRFDHTIIPARDRRESAEFFADMFGLDEPTEAGSFLQVHLDDGAAVDFAEPPIDFPGHHYAFLVDDGTFDRVLDRLRERDLPHWADPQQRRPGEMNTNHGGRGVYFDDPSGHHLEAMTVRYDGTKWWETWW